LGGLGAAESFAGDEEDGGDRRGKEAVGDGSRVLRLVCVSEKIQDGEVQPLDSKWRLEEADGRGNGERRRRLRSVASSICAGRAKEGKGKGLGFEGEGEVLGVYLSARRNRRMAGAWRSPARARAVATAGQRRTTAWLGWAWLAMR
jgi:hypothetical protein